MDRRNISFSPPDISELEIEEVVQTLKSGWITTGPRTKLLERRLAAYIETGRTDIDTETDLHKASSFHEYGAKAIIFAIIPRLRGKGKSRADRSRPGAGTERSSHL